MLTAVLATALSRRAREGARHDGAAARHAAAPGAAARRQDCCPISRSRWRRRRSSWSRPSCVFGVRVHGALLDLFVATLRLPGRRARLGAARLDHRRHAGDGVPDRRADARMLPAIFLSGFIFPMRTLPLPLQVITYVVPARYYLVVLRGVVLKGAILAPYLDQMAVPRDLTRWSSWRSHGCACCGRRPDVYVLLPRHRQGVPAAAPRPPDDPHADRGAADAAARARLSPPISTSTTYRCSSSTATAPSRAATSSTASSARGTFELVGTEDEHRRASSRWLVDGRAQIALVIGERYGADAARRPPPARAADRRRHRLELGRSSAWATPPRIVGAGRRRAGRGMPSGRGQAGPRPARRRDRARAARLVQPGPARAAGSTCRRFSPWC